METEINQTVIYTVTIDGHKFEQVGLIGESESEIKKSLLLQNSFARKLMTNRNGFKSAISIKD